MTNMCELFSISLKLIILFRQRLSEVENLNVADQREFLNLWYEAIKSQDLEEADNWKKRFDSRSGLFTDPELGKLYDLLQLRYHLLRQDYGRAEESLRQLRPEAVQAHWLNYYYHFFKGIYHYDRLQYDQAIDHYKKANFFTEQLTPDESAEFYYKLAAAYHRNYEITRSIKCAETALDIFRQKSHHKRVTACEILLGINNKDIAQYKEAERHYHNALIAVEKSGDRLLKIMVYHNYGVLSSNQGDPKASLSFLKKAKRLIEPWENRMKVQSLYLLANNYYQSNERDIARRKLHFAIMIAEQSRYPDYIHHCTMLKSKYERPDQFEAVYRQGISFFSERGRWDNVTRYSEELAAYYREKGFHEMAGEFYELAALSRNKLKKERVFSHG